MGLLSSAELQRGLAIMGRYRKHIQSYLESFLKGWSVAKADEDWDCGIKSTSPGGGGKECERVFTANRKSYKFTTKQRLNHQKKGRSLHYYSLYKFHVH